MSFSYKDYRSFGHGPVIAWTLAQTWINPVLIILLLLCNILLWITL